MEKITNGRLPSRLGVESSSSKWSRPTLIFKVRTESNSELSASDTLVWELPAKRRRTNSTRLCGAIDEVKQKFHRLFRALAVDQLDNVMAAGGQGVFETDGGLGEKLEGVQNVGLARIIAVP